MAHESAWRVAYLPVRRGREADLVSLVVVVEDDDAVGLKTSCATSETQEEAFCNPRLSRLR